MDEKGQDGAATSPMKQRIGDVHRQGLLAEAFREDDTCATEISIHTNMNVEGQPENFYRQAPLEVQSPQGAAGSSAGGYTYLSLRKTNLYFLTHPHIHTQVCVLPRSQSNTWRTDSIFIVIIVYKI